MIYIKTSPRQSKSPRTSAHSSHANLPNPNSIPRLFWTYPIIRVSIEGILSSPTNSQVPRSDREVSEVCVKSHITCSHLDATQNRVPGPLIIKGCRWSNIPLEARADNDIHCVATICFLSPSPSSYPEPRNLHRYHLDINNNPLCYNSQKSNASARHFRRC